MGYNRRSGSGTNRHSDGGNFKRSRAALKYYSYGTQAAKIDEARDEVSLKYYGRLAKIDNRKTATGSAAKIFCALIVCVSAIIMVFSSSMVYNIQLENDEMQKELEKKREKTISMTAQNTEKIDVSYVEEVATTRLNMAKPQSYQIVYIDVPKTDYTENHEALTVTEKEKPVFLSYQNAVASIKEAGEIFLAKKASKQ